MKITVRVKTGILIFKERKRVWSYFTEFLVSKDTR